MFSSASAANYRCTDGLLVWYEQELADVTGYIKVTRHATKKYAYLDLTESAAQSVASSRVSMYTRRFDNWTVDNSTTPPTIVETKLTELKTDVGTSRNECGSFDVTVSVNETDTKVVKSSSYLLNPKSYFTDANSRSYEENVHSLTTVGLDVYSRRKNFKMTELLSVRYAVQEQDGGYLYSRYATESFEYFGMNQLAAKNCAKAKRSQFCRKYAYTDGVSNHYKIANGAEISLSHDSLTWAVKVRINETDQKFSLSNVSPASLFTFENDRNYNRNGPLNLESVTLVSWDDESMTWHCTAVADVEIEDVTLDDTELSYRIGEDLTWHPVSSVTWVGNSGSFDITSETGGDFIFRITYGTLESDYVVAEPA